jgi:hypothetical protein
MSRDVTRRNACNAGQRPESENKGRWPAVMKNPATLCGKQYGKPGAVP